LIRNKDVPFFKEVVVMSSACDACGYKNNEIKSGGAIAPKGRKITLKVIKPEDLCRDVLKVPLPFNSLFQSNEDFSFISFSLSSFNNTRIEFCYLIQNILFTFVS
jgi:hypothetical protein